MHEVGGFGEWYWVLGHQVRPLRTIGEYGMVEVVSPPDVPGPPPHHHERDAELFYIADGSLDVAVGGEWRRLSTGDSATVEAGVTHTFINRSQAPCRWITAFSPRGFERFFLDFGVPVDQPGAQEASVAPEVIERVGRECVRYGMVLDLP